MGIIQDRGSHIAATSAITAQAGAHGQFGNITHTIGSGALDGFIGDTKANTDIHGGFWLGYE